MKVFKIVLLKRITIVLYTIAILLCSLNLFLIIAGYGAFDERLFEKSFGRSMALFVSLYFFFILSFPFYLIAVFIRRWIRHIELKRLVDSFGTDESTAN
jgi:hypothetical protein